MEGPIQFLTTPIDWKYAIIGSAIADESPNPIIKKISEKMSYFSVFCLFFNQFLGTFWTKNPTFQVSTHENQFFQCSPAFRIEWHRPFFKPTFISKVMNFLTPKSVKMHVKFPKPVIFLITFTILRSKGPNSS